MAGDYLPPVVARLTMDLGDFMSGIAQAKAAMQGLSGDFKIGTDGLDAAAAKVKALQASLQGLQGTVKVNTDGLGALTAKTAAAGAAAGAAGAMWIAGWRLTGTALHWIIAGGVEVAAVVIPALVALAAGLAVAAQGGQMVQQHFQALYTTSEATSNMFHQSVGNILGMHAALQAAQNAANPSVYGILGSALITVNEHFGNLAQTGLQVVQMFQTFAAKVAVDFGPGGSLGTETTALLSHMTADLQGLGQVFGNIGHALLSFASQMPGLAEVLLRGLVGITGLVSAAAQLAGRFQVMGVSVLTVAMGFEEFNRWGGLLANTLTRLGLASASLQGGAFSFARFTSVLQGLYSVIPTVIGLFGQLIARSSGLFSALSMAAGDNAFGSFFGKISTGAAQAGTAMQGAAADANSFIKSLSFGQLAGITLAAAAIAAMAYQLVTARTAAQQFTDSLQAGVMKASNVQAFNVIASNIAGINAQIAATRTAAPTLAAVGQAEDRAAQSGTRFGASMDMAGMAALNTKTQLAGLSAGLRQQDQDAANVAAGAAYLAHTYGTTFAGALALADEANVKLATGITGTSQAAMVARMQIQSLVSGYQAMGAPMSAIGSDMEMLALQSGLASSQIQQLNSAADSFISGLTGGTSGMATYVLDLKNVSNAAGNLHSTLSQLSGNAGIQNFASQLKSFTATGAQAWQNFNQLVTSGNSLLDWMRTAGAEGALSGTQFRQGMLDMVSSLYPLASASKTAQSEVMGLVEQVDPSIKTWGQLGQAIQQSGATLGGLSGIIATGTQGMENLSAVTQKLGNVLSTALVSALQAAQVQASGAGSAMEAYAQALMSGNQAAAAADYNQVISDLEKLGLSAQQAAQLIASVTQNLKNAQGNYSATFTVTTEYVNGSPPGGGILPTPTGHATGTASAPPGWAWVGEMGPELVKFTGGEVVLPHQVSVGYAGGVGSPGGDIHNHFYVDGKEIYGAMQSQAASTQRRTGHTGLSRRTR